MKGYGVLLVRLAIHSVSGTTLPPFSVHGGRPPRSDCVGEKNQGIESVLDRLNVNSVDAKRTIDHRCFMYAIFTYMWLTYVIYAGIYSIRGAYGCCKFFGVFVRWVFCPSILIWPLFLPRMLRSTAIKSRNHWFYEFFSHAVLVSTNWSSSTHMQCTWQT